MVFTSSQAETWRPWEEAQLWGSWKVTEAAAFHQDGGRCTAPRAEDHAKMSAGFYVKCCCLTAPLQSGGPAPLAEVAQQT